ncbi:hypothetical protein ACFO3D_04145 [Virgibacillus kekensis]|uniref:Uncharacterized protein n=1 Tax=Virgibacillus kekensis TaxID=202261 RepID=A0ABV9DHR8_9BACI
MANGLIFYWLSWMLWIVITFFLNKSFIRTMAACFTLAMIFLAETYINLMSLKISLSYILLLGLLIVFQAKKKQLLLHTFTAFSVAVGYMGTLIWVNFTPLNLFFPSDAVIFVVLLLLISNIISKPKSRLVAGSLGITVGEIGYSLISIYYGYKDIVGDMGFFDLLTPVVGVIFIHTYIIEARRKANKSNIITRQKLRKNA